MQAATIPVHSTAPASVPERPYGSATSSGPDTADAPSFSDILSRLLGKKSDEPSRIDAKAQTSRNHSRGEKSPIADSKATPSRNAFVAKGAVGKAAGTLALRRSDSTARTDAVKPNVVAKADNSAVKVLLHATETASAAKSRNAAAKKTELAAGNAKARTKNRGDAVEDTPGADAITVAVAANGPNLSVKAKEPAEGAGSKERETRSGSSRASGKRETKVSVVDLRMKPESKGNGTSQGAKPVEGPESSREGAFVSGHATDGSAPFEKTESPSPQPGASFSDILSRHLADSGSQDIVKAAQIVLRDGDSGLIRLRLEPESLGNVKIELKMTEKNITGRIIVETDEARSAFEKNMAGLKDAFSAGGFETASLEVSVNGGETGGGGNAREDAPEPFFTERLKELDAAVPVATAAVRAESGVNILA